MDISVSLQAFLWGGFSGGALLVGALIGFFIKLPPRAVSGVMAFGVGVLISALSFELMEESVKTGGVFAAATGFVLGAAIYSAANAVLDTLGARHRKRSKRPGNARTASAGAAIAVGALIDGIPESAAIGVSLLSGEGVALVTVLAIAISNIPEGLSSSAGMKQDGKSARQVMGLWLIIALICAASAFLGYAVLGKLDQTYIAASMAVAAGAILVMLVQTMVPEAFEDIHSFTGPIAALGFLTAFVASNVLG